MIRESERTGLRSSRFGYRAWGLSAAGLVGLSLILAWVSSRFTHVEGGQGFLVLLILGAGLVLGVRFALRGENLPAWLTWLTVGAVFLRLFAGALWYIVLPVAGYASGAELAGYVMADAHERDQTAWELARSEKPLDRAFQGGYRKADQYGGMLYLSAAIYRNLSGDQHRPLLIVVLTAFVSSLGIFFTWAFANRVWGMRTAGVSAWLLALYPEAVLLGSSQMREAFTITFFVMAFYGLACLIQERDRKALGWIAAGLLLSVPFSPPFAALLFIFLIPLGFSLEGGLTSARAWKDRRVWLVTIILGGLVLVAVWMAWRNFAPEDISSPLGVIRWWVRKSSDLQAHLSKSASGWVQKIFAATPAWSHVPMLVLYGVIQPFLPAAISDVTGALIWRAIAIWRAAGWTLILPFLILAPLAALRRSQAGEHRRLERRLALVLSLIVWAGILIASFRGGGDQWDNPRYRAAFTAFQVILVAWVWTRPRNVQDVWLKRLLAGLGIILAWYFPWYLRRYVHLPWPVEGFFPTLVLGLASAVMYAVGDWASSFSKSPDP